MAINDENIGTLTGIYEHKYDFKLERNDIPSDCSTLPAWDLQKKINFYFKPYSGAQEFSSFMRFKDNDSNE